LAEGVVDAVDADVAGVVDHVVDRADLVAQGPEDLAGRAVGGDLLVTEDVVRGAGLPEVTVAEVGVGRVGGGGGRAFLLELQGDVRAVVDEDRAVDVLGRGGAVRIEDLADPAVLVVVGVLDIT